MELDGVLRSAESYGQLSAASFGISEGDTVHILRILRDRLYSDKALAVVREYVSNAWDAHVEAGKADLAVKVTLPTSLEETLAVRDWGVGLSEEDVYGVYAKYGASTRRRSNLVVGALGIGSKAAFCYGDSFTITSWHGGRKSVYVAFLDESDVGVVQKMDETPCSPEETGIEIRVPTRSQDRRAFQVAAERLLPFISPLPTVNIPVEPHSVEPLGQHQLLTKKSNALPWYAVMGCIPYVVAPEYVSPDWDCTRGILCAAIGSLDVVASRERLEYTPKTKDTLARLFGEALQSCRERVRHALEGLSPWAGRVSLLDSGLSRGLLPEGYYPCTYRVILRNHGGSPSGSYYLEEVSATKSRVVRSPIDNVVVSQSTALVLDDVSSGKKGKNGYLRGALGEYKHVFLVGRKTGATWEEATQELEQHLTRKKLTGVPIRNLSACPYKPLVRQRGVTKYPPGLGRWHSGRCFSGGGALPGPEDLWVSVERGQVAVYVSAREADAMLRNLFNVPLPDVYGVRKSYTRKLDPSREMIPWLLRKLTDLLAQHPDVALMVKYREDAYYLADLAPARKLLPAGHPLSGVVATASTWAGRGVSLAIAGRILGAEPDGSLKEQYPLLFSRYSGEPEPLVEYVLAVDQYRANKAQQEEQEK